MVFLLRISHIFLLVVLLLLLFPFQSNAITIFVDGMNRDITEGDLAGGNYERRGSYLMGSSLGKELKKKDNKQEPLEWNGDILKEYKNNSAANNLYDKIKSIKSNPKTKDEPINIVSHSYGTVIAYNALQKLNNDPTTKKIKIDSLTTMGSPLGSQDGLELTERINKFYNPSISSGKKEQVASIIKNLLKTPNKLNNVKQWTNLWADNDNVSGKINVKGVKNIQIDADSKNHGKWWSQKVEGTIQGEYGDKINVSNLKTIDIWHRAYYTPIENLKIKSTGEVINWNIPKDYSNALMSGKIESFKGAISLPDSGKGEAPGQQVSGHKEDTIKSLAQYESMSKKDLRKELEQKFGPNAKYDKMSKRELISALTGVSKEQIHTSSSDKGKDQSKDLDHYEKMSKADLRKEMEKKFGHKDAYDKMSAREMVSALTGVSKEKVHMAGKDREYHANKDESKSKDLDRYENMTKKDLRKELEKKAGHKDNYDKMSKRELISALTGVPKDKIGKDDKEKKDHAEAKDDDGHKKDGKDKGHASRLTKQQVEEIWKARPDVQQNVHAKKKGDPYEKTQTWWDKYGQKEMGNFLASAPAPSSPPATASMQTSSPSTSSSTPGLNPTKKLSKAQIEEIWKTRADVAQDARSHKGVDPYKQTQKWWDNYGRKEMSGYQFAGTTPPPASTSPPKTSSPPATPLLSPIASPPTPPPSEPATGPLASQPARPVPSSGRGKLSGSAAKVIVDGKELGDGKYVKDNGYWVIKDGKIVSTGPLVNMTGKPIVDTKDAVKLGSNDKLIIDGHEIKTGYRTLVAPGKRSEIQKSEDGLKQREKPQEGQRRLKEVEQRQAVEKTQRDQQEKQRKEEAKHRESEQRKVKEQQERAKKEEKQKALIEEKRQREEQRRAEQERQRQAKLEAKRLQEEQKRQQAEQRKAQEQQRRAQQLQQQQQIRQQQQQQQAMQQQLRQEEARRQQAQLEQQRIEAQRRQQQQQQQQMLQQQQMQQQQPPRRGR